MLPKKVFSKEKGAVMVLVALLFPVLLGFLGMVIDYGMIYNRQTKMQNAADAAALAGAGQLPNTTNARNQAQTYADYNYTDSKQVNVGFVNNNSQVDVTLNSTYMPYFLSLFGLNTVPLQAAASASLDTGGVFDYAIFSGSQTNDLDITGGGWWVRGSIHTNRNLLLTGGGFQVTQSAEASKNVTVTGGGYSIGKIINNANVLSMPDYSSQVAAAAAAAGQVYAGNKSITSGGVSVNSPMYVQGKVTITGGNFTGNGVIMADGDITITGGAVTIAGTAQVCFYSKNGNITITGGGSSFNGVLYAPKGTITFTGGGVTVNGSIVGNLVKLTGGSINVNRADYPITSLPYSVRLVK